MKRMEIKTILIDKEEIQRKGKDKRKGFRLNQLLTKELRNGWRFKQVKYLSNCLKKQLFVFERELNGI